MGELRDCVLAVTALLDHPDHLGKLPLRPAQPGQGRSELRAREFEIHHHSLSIPPGVMHSILRKVDES